MSLSNTAETNLLKLILQNVTWANIGDATGLVGSGAAGNLYISLHLADPGEAGTQATNEATFTSYVRVAVARTAGAWAVVSGVGSNIAAITFAACTGGTNVITYVGIGRGSAGAGELIFSGQLNTPITISLSNPVFAFAASALTVIAN